MTADAPRCAGPDACAWPGICLPGRCTWEEAHDSPNFARFAPRSEPAYPGRRMNGDGDACSRVAPDGAEHRGTFPLWGWRQFALDELPQLGAALMLWAALYCVIRALAKFWGV